MAQERLTMRKIKEILRLKHEAKFSNRVIAGACKVSNSTVGEYLRKAEAIGISWPLGEIGEEELYSRLFPEKKTAPAELKRLVPDWDKVQREKKKKVSLSNCCGRSTKKNTRKGINTRNFVNTISAGRKAGLSPVDILSIPAANKCRSIMPG